MTLGDRVAGAVTRLQLGRVFVMAFILFAALDIGVRVIERTPDLMLRNEGRSHGALPYLFDQMSRTKHRTVVAFLGASVVQGIMNTTPERTAPVMVQNILDDRGVPARCFNMATIGNNLGDHLGIATESIRNGAKVIVCPLHFKLFSGMGTLNTMVCYPDTAFYLRKRPDFVRLRREVFHLSDRDFQEAAIGLQVERLWAFYRERTLLSYLFTGDSEPLSAHLRMWLFQTLRVPRQDEDTGISERGSPAARNRDNIWQSQPDAYHRNNTETYDRVSLDESDAHYRVLQQIMNLSREKRVRMLFYYVPLNRRAVDEYGYFDWRRHARFKSITGDMAAKTGNTVVDLTDSVDNRYFTDGDHLNMNGHAQLAQALAPEVEKLLPEEPR